MRFAGHRRAGIQIFHDEVVVLRQIEVERIIRCRHDEIGSVSAFEFASVIALGRGLRGEKIGIVDRRAIAVIAIGEPFAAGCGTSSTIAWPSQIADQATANGNRRMM